ncbi:testis-expressed protein 52-like isoform X2 [Scyliorhinus torazame]|uniref:testis-expressed protein 52-like isoform X2 n=1 Tax=Scyliorhinus torazame TaxID=75743 RepID=UPI003B5BA71B
MEASLERNGEKESLCNMIQLPSWERQNSHATPVSKSFTGANKEFLPEDKHVKFSGFQPKAQQRHVLHPPRHKDVMEEFFQRMHASLRSHSLKHHNWLDVGKFTPIFSNRPDKEFNSNVWRCYVSKDSEKHSTTGKARVSKLIASLYPIAIPPPSKMGENTWLQFVSCGNLYIDLQGKKKAITILEKELEHNRKLMIKSESRMPPIDSHGNILPPGHIKGHTPSIPRLPPGCIIFDTKDYKRTTCNVTFENAASDTISLCSCQSET